MKLFNKTIKKDKILHFIVGALISISSFCFAWGLSYDIISAIIAGICIPAFAGWMKEMLDPIIKGTRFSWQDLLATVIGGGVGTLICIIFNLFLY